ncbi:hypothetical protein ADUPG1_006422 [Aduncisulcus paluster]|uniref:Uncharacterized protein n=1 Tax=Aduncisulcus paluster TaxID=2918883 RepID=A0ABQ5KI74_9EUKA|nr:hypothetical protein ADUPG1_006422 [Aduncisulcus paluster]
MTFEDSEHLTPYKALDLEKNVRRRIVETIDETFLHVTVEVISVRWITIPFRFPLPRIDDALKVLQDLPSSTRVQDVRKVKVTPFEFSPGSWGEQIDGWRRIGLSRGMLRELEMGISLPLSSRAEGPVHDLRRDFLPLIEEYLKIGVLVEAPVKAAFPVSTVPKKGTSEIRLIHDLRGLNRRISPQKEGIELRGDDEGSAVVDGGNEGTEYYADPAVDPERMEQRSRQTLTPGRRGGEETPGRRENIQEDGWKRTRDELLFISNKNYTSVNRKLKELREAEESGERSNRFIEGGNSWVPKRGSPGPCPKTSRFISNYGHGGWESEEVFEHIRQEWYEKKLGLME